MRHSRDHRILRTQVISRSRSLAAVRDVVARVGRLRLPAPAGSILEPPDAHNFHRPPRSRPPGTFSAGSSEHTRPVSNVPGSRIATKAASTPEWTAGTI